MLLKHDHNVKAYENDEEVLAIAKNMGLTKQGEMFSGDLPYSVSSSAFSNLTCKMLFIS